MRIKPGRLFQKPKARIVREHAPDPWPRRVWLEIDGMVCDICARRVRRGLESLDGVVQAEVDLDMGGAALISNGEVKEEDLTRAIEDKVILSWARGALSRLNGGGR
ncbi:MAG: heavy metal-associated domain-containing protein [Dehalococcoidia bacterium]